MDTDKRTDPDLPVNPDEILSQITELKQRAAADQAALSHYDQTDEALRLLDEANQRVAQAEDILRKLITERQAKTMEIEKEIKALK